LDNSIPIGVPVPGEPWLYPYRIIVPSLEDYELTNPYVAPVLEPEINWYDITSESNATAEQINKALKGTKLAGLGQAYVDAELKYQINAIYLTAITIHESG